MTIGNDACFPLCERNQLTIMSAPCSSSYLVVINKVSIRINQHVEGGREKGQDLESQKKRPRVLIKPHLKPGFHHTSHLSESVNCPYLKIQLKLVFL